jgi:RNA polymerase sigma factor (sigma-70 family)
MNRAERERLFQELFAANKERVRRLCYGYLGPAGEVDDLFQEIMVHVWNSLPSFRGESAPGTWLYRIAINTALVYRRKRRTTEPLPELADRGSGAHQDLEARERLTALHRASLDFVRHGIAELEKQRDPFRRFYWPFLGSLAVGESLLFAFTGHPATLWERIVWQLLAALLPFAAYELGRRVRARRFESECLPLIAQLRAIEASLKERQE